MMKQTSITTHGKKRVRYAGLSVLVAAMAALIGCSTVQPMPTVGQVDLERFMGDWYVIAHIPTFIEKTAYNAVETYRLNDNGTIAVTFTINDDALNGPQKVYKAKGFVRDQQTNALWGVQFIWPFKAEYRIIYLTDDYSQTVIGRSKRDYLWIMARRPSIPGHDYQQMIEFVEAQGYDVKQIRKVPHNSKGE